MFLPVEVIVEADRPGDNRLTVILCGCDGTFPPRSSSVGLMASSPGSNEREAGNASDVECGHFMRYRKNSLGLVAKNRKNRHYIYEPFSWRRWRPKSPVRLPAQEASVGSHQGRRQASS
jgi:hypothetical protein